MRRVGVGLGAWGACNAPLRVDGLFHGIDGVAGDVGDRTVRGFG